MAVITGNTPVEHVDAELGEAATTRTDLTDADRAALWLYARLVGTRHRPLVPPHRRLRARFGVVYDESGYPIQS